MKATIKDIAGRCGVSITTVSRVINNKMEGVSSETREKIMDAIEQLNYKPNSIARSMVTKKTNTVALVIPDICNPFFPELARGVEDCCTQEGYNLFLCNTDGSAEKELSYIRFLRERLVDGIIFTTQNAEEFSNVFYELRSENFPFVFIERYIDDMEDLLGVYVDNTQGVYRAVKHLFDNGHRNIAFITGPFSTTNAVMRFKGFQQAHLELDIDINYNLVKEGDYKVQSGYNQMKNLLEEFSGKFTAVMASNDLMAIGACNAVKEAGLKVPEDISVIGFDNISFTDICDPRITSVGIPIYNMGFTASKLLIDILRGNEPQSKKLIFDAELIIKQSVGRLKSNFGGEEKQKVNAV